MDINIYFHFHYSYLKICNHIQTQAFNDDLVATSSDQLAPCTESMKCVSLSCGHTNQGFRCFEAQMPCDDERFSMDGKLSVKRLHRCMLFCMFF